MCPHTPRSLLSSDDERIAHMRPSHAHICLMHPILQETHMVLQDNQSPFFPSATIDQRINHNRVINPSALTS